MEPKKNYRIRELGDTTLTLRGDLVFTPRAFGDDTCYIVEDPINSKFYRLGIAEYTFVSLLDGRTSLREALALTARVLADGGLTDEQAAATAKWLVEANLAFTNESTRPGRLADMERSAERARRWQQWNPISTRIPLFHPDAFFDVVTPWFAWIHSGPAIAVWIGCVLAGLYEVCTRWRHFVAASDGIFAPDNWLSLSVCWLVLKTVHEFSHGLVCKKYGGTVREVGVVLFMLVPVAYVDVTSAWRFRSRWRRIHVAAAGMYVELFIAAVAALLWSRTAPGPLNFLCCHVVVMASLMTVLFNANPFMMYDGYYILADFLELPNLYSNGQRCLRHWARRHLLGLGSVLPAWSPRRLTVIALYGVVAVLWRMAFCVGMVITAARFFHGAGIVLSGLAVALWWGLPMVRFARYMAVGTSTEQLNRLRFVSTAGIAAGVAVAILTLVPWPGSPSAPAVVEYSPLTLLRTASAGFVREVRVGHGQFVREGQVLAVLDNEELCAELADLELAANQSRLKIRALEKKGQIAGVQAETENLESLEKKHQEKQAQVDQLTLRAQVTGKIVGRNLDTLVGRYFQSGAELMAIVNEDAKELLISVSQDDFDAFAGNGTKPVQVRMNGVRMFDSTLLKLNPRASLELATPALAAAYGGPLPVRRKRQETDSMATTTARFELLAPRFTGSVPLDDSRGIRLSAGQRATVMLAAHSERIGEHLYRSLGRWLRQQLHPVTNGDSTRPRG